VIWKLWSLRRRRSRNADVLASVIVADGKRSQQACGERAARAAGVAGLARFAVLHDEGDRLPDSLGPAEMAIPNQALAPASVDIQMAP
jgi:hypothetical protein